MGFWNFMSSIIDSLKHSLKRIWGYVSSVTDSLKSGIADLITPVKNACQSSYDNVCATVSKIDHAVRVDAVKILNQYLPDQEARLQFAINLAKNIFDIVFHKYVPGGVRLYRIASKSLSDVKKFEDPKKEDKALKLRVDKMEKEISMCRKEVDKMEQEISMSRKELEQVLEQAEMNKRPDVELKSQNTLHFDSNAYQKLDDYGDDQILHDEGIHVPLAWVI